MPKTNSPAPYFLLTNLLVLGLATYAYVLFEFAPDAYDQSVEEDGYLEWATFWAFLIAAVAYLRQAAAYRVETRLLPWFLIGVAAFCVVVAMEEISWGQRLLSYRPPVYFLANNYQQEFNFHNVVETSHRKLALKILVGGYGIVLPILMRIELANKWLQKLGIVAPPIWLIPSYAVTLGLYIVYPWSHSGEWVEAMLGLCFLFSALDPANDQLRNKSVNRSRFSSAGFAAAGFVLVATLGLASAVYSKTQRDENPLNRQAAMAEVEAIAGDFESGFAKARCNLHKRVYTFVEEYEQSGLRRGEFAQLQSQGLPSERAEFFIDPWNSPYWLRVRCDSKTDRETAFIYSFGPNRRRESTQTEIRGDDIGSMFIRQ